jgi:hypothetical protein
VISLKTLDAVIQEVLEEEYVGSGSAKEVEDLKCALLDRLQMEFDVVDDTDEEDSEEEVYED